MIEQPFRNTRDSQPYLAIATAITMDEFPGLGTLFEEVFGWLAAHDVAPAGPSFVRILTSDMSAKLDIEVGVPVSKPHDGDGRITPGTIPAGSYVTLFYTVEVENDHIEANVAIQAWAAQEGVEWRFDRSGEVERWGGRFTFSLDGDGGHNFELTYQIADE